MEQFSLKDIDSMYVNEENSIIFDGTILTEENIDTVQVKSLKQFIVILQIVGFFLESYFLYLASYGLEDGTLKTVFKAISFFGAVTYIFFVVKLAPRQIHAIYIVTKEPVCYTGVTWNAETTNRISSYEKRST